MKKLILTMVLCLTSTVAQANQQDINICAERIKEIYGANIIKDSGLDAMTGCIEYGKSQGRTPDNADKISIKVFKSIEANNVTHYACYLNKIIGGIMISPISANYYKKFGGAESCLASQDIITLVGAANMYRDENSLLIDRKKGKTKPSTQPKSNTSQIGKSTRL